MVYYTEDDELEIGLLYNEKEKKELTVNEFIKIGNTFSSDIDKIMPNNLTATQRQALLLQIGANTIMKNILIKILI